MGRLQYNTAQIAWIQSTGIQTCCHMINHETKTSMRRLFMWQRRLNGFSRIHEDYLVNLDYIASLEFGESPHIRLINGDVLPVSRSKQLLLADELMHHIEKT